jgi:hypothetical protein
MIQPVHLKKDDTVFESYAESDIGYFLLFAGLAVVIIAAIGSRDSSVGIGTRYRLGRPSFDSYQRQEILLFSTASRPWGPTRLLPSGYQRLSPWVKLPRREADHPFSSSTVDEND